MNCKEIIKVKFIDNMKNIYLKAKVEP